MSWSLEVFSPRREPVSIAELEQCLSDMPPVLQVIFRLRWRMSRLTLRRPGCGATSHCRKTARTSQRACQAVKFDTERDADPAIAHDFG
jgi:hypothetical protein